VCAWQTCVCMCSVVVCKRKTECIVAGKKTSAQEAMCMPRHECVQKGRTCLRAMSQMSRSA